MLFKIETLEQQRTAIQSVVEVFLYPSFGAPLVSLWCLGGVVVSRVSVQLS